jgi:hypothetical protein
MLFAFILCYLNLVVQWDSIDWRTAGYISYTITKTWRNGIFGSKSDACQNNCDLQKTARVSALFLQEWCVNLILLLFNDFWKHFVGVVKKAVGTILKIVHCEPVFERPKGKADDTDWYKHAIADYNHAIADNKDIEALLTRSKQNLLTPLRVLELFDNVSPDVIYYFFALFIFCVQDVPLLLCADEPLHTLADMLLTRLPVPPCCIRPSVVSDTRMGVYMILISILFILRDNGGRSYNENNRNIVH